MSTKAKTVFATSFAVMIGTIIGVHFQQKFDKAAMHQGVIRDMEQQRVKRERQADFEMQRELESEYRKVQNVSDTSHA
ncbi:hypothetical protein LTR95_013902 [Oleoguttula sp. CCFEE 5521]|uniref:Cytochrome c oxidase assembly protein n=1 Tax=Cryoendolithus antarcticus TaxID=1507870 RepID=A0A1V8SB44_9PEZI|nr:hypothetical protein B0A48_17549 [Cryoendolithus antarcticus]OQN96836.1 hypothetical protein B0A48_17396 [Cryoendolithus antarcticus]OQO26712.1 hypothetical protein B0A51_03959 [Rachicladosporium sp. CCFEE 5018]